MISCFLGPVLKHSPNPSESLQCDALDDKRNGSILNHGRQKDSSGSDSRVILGPIILRIAIGSKNGLSDDDDNVFV